MIDEAEKPSCPEGIWRVPAAAHLCRRITRRSISIAASRCRRQNRHHTSLVSCQWLLLSSTLVKARLAKIQRIRTDTDQRDRSCMGEVGLNKNRRVGFPSPNHWKHHMRAMRAAAPPAGAVHMRANVSRHSALPPPRPRPATSSPFAVSPPRSARAVVHGSAWSVTDAVAPPIAAVRLLGEAIVLTVMLGSVLKSARIRGALHPSRPRPTARCVCWSSISCFTPGSVRACRPLRPSDRVSAPSPLARPARRRPPRPRPISP